MIRLRKFCIKTCTRDIFLTPSLIGSVNDRIVLLTNQQVVLIGLIFSCKLEPFEKKKWVYCTCSNIPIIKDLIKVHIRKCHASVHAVVRNFFKSISCHIIDLRVVTASVQIHSPSSGFYVLRQLVNLNLNPPQSLVNITFFKPIVQKGTFFCWFIQNVVHDISTKSRISFHFTTYSNWLTVIHTTDVHTQYTHSVFTSFSTILHNHELIFYKIFVNLVFCCQIQLPTFHTRMYLHVHVWAS